MAKQKRKLVAKEQERSRVAEKNAPNAPVVKQLRSGWGMWLTLGVSWLVLMLIVGMYVYESRRSALSRGLKQRVREAAKKQQEVAPEVASAEEAKGEAPPTRYFASGNLTLVWDKIKPEVRQLVNPTSTSSNMARKDFAGSQSCAECHKENYAEWSEHPHRWMNALANAESIKGDFGGSAELRYRGGVAKFYREGDKYRMRFDRDDLHREYEISQTIGSRFYQYYVGKGIAGPEPTEHDYYKKDHVLPFGYWLSRRTWVPIVHVADELPDGERWESVEQVKPPASGVHGAEGVGRSRGVFDHTQELGLTYASSCNFCHTTFPLADMFVRMPDQMGATLKQRTLFELSQHVADSHPQIFDGSKPAEQFPSEAIEAMTATFIAFDAREQAASLGVACEACHLGCLEHVQQPKTKPAFAPQSPRLLTFKEDPAMETGRKQANLNAICARCHTGTRPTYAAGMATWNSTEHSDAMRGSCYSKLACVDCHDPHKATGRVWPKTPEEDDASCVRCHQQFTNSATRQLHTHHAQGSAGDRCMNCHMPHINEGIEEVVRTHTIFSPTQPDMIASGQPNACNLCHLDKPIDWTLGYLKSWYGKSYAEGEIAKSYPNRDEAVGMMWLKHSQPATRLVAAAAFAREKARWGLPELLKLLDDPYLVNRQFAQTSMEKLIDRRLDEAVGYWFYMGKEERQGVWKELEGLIE